MKEKFIFTLLILGIVLVSACTSQKTNNLDEFENLCKNNGHMWMEMEEMMDGEFIGGDMCSGCMPSDNMGHFCNMEDYKKYMDESGGHVMSHNAMTAHGGGKGSVDLHLYRIGFVRPEAQSRKEALLTFTINEISSGNPVSDLQIVHDKIMHVVLVRDDLKYFDHIHPKMIEPGKFTVPYTFLASGTYRIWIDFTIDGMQHIVDFDLNVSGIAIPEKNSLYGLKVVMEEPEEIMTGQETVLRFVVTDNENRPVTIIEKFLAANAHLIAIDETLLEFGHNHDEKFDKDNTILFTHKFPKSGKYKLWVQFVANGKETTADFDLVIK